MLTRQKADLLRYLLLLLRGGIYTDTDTYMLRHPSWWGEGAKLWRDGEGWLSAEERARLRDGENVYDVLGRPSVVVGIEADVGGREDWHDWYPRPVSPSPAKMEIQGFIRVDSGRDR